MCNKYIQLLTDTSHYLCTQLAEEQSFFYVEKQTFSPNYNKTTVQLEQSKSINLYE